MSPHVGNFVQDLVEMAKAVETVPILQGELETTKQKLDEAERHNQGLEQNIISYKSQIEDLQSKVRSLEVERDDASFRVLESEDLAHKALSFAKQAESAAAAVMSLLDPPKPEPELQPQAVPVPTQDEKNTAQATMYGEGKPTEGQSETTPMEPSSQMSGGDSTGQHSEEAPKSDANPTAKEETTSLETVSSHSAPSLAVDTTVGKGPYFDKRYHDMPNYIGFHDWIDGGGSELNYYWRPSATGSF